MDGARKHKGPGVGMNLRFSRSARECDQSRETEAQMAEVIGLLIGVTRALEGSGL